MSGPVDLRDGDLLTVGHSTATQPELTSLLHGAGIAVIVDVRRSPGSRRHPQFGRDLLERWLPAAGIAYVWEERLGGRRPRVQGSPHTALRDPAFQGYADHLDTPEFRAAVDEVLTLATQRRTALMCAEARWTSCHRRYIADHVQLLTDVAVRHLLHDGTLADHQPHELARVEDGRLVYDGGAPTLL